MKIRNGFVSNSSSSSFLVIGVEAAGLSESDCKKLEQKLGRVYTYESKFPELYGDSYHASDYEIEEISFDSMVDTVNQIRDILGDDAKIRVYFGERCG